MKGIDMTQQEKEYIEKYFDEKFNNMKEFLTIKIRTNEEAIDCHTTTIKELQDKTEKNTIDIAKIKTRIEGMKEIDKEVKEVKTEAKSEKLRTEDRKFDMKKLLWGIPIAIIIFLLQLGASGIINILFP